MHTELYDLTDPVHGPRRVQIGVFGTRVQVASGGPAGLEPRTPLKFSTPALAQADFRRRVHRLVRRGYRLEVRNTELEALLDWNDPGSFAVLADWLVERGNPRGHMIQAALAAEAGVPGAAAEVEQLMRAWPVQLVPSMEGIFTWKLGFIEGVKIHRWVSAEQTQAELGVILAKLAQHPSAQLIRWAEGALWGTPHRHGETVRHHREGSMSPGRTES